MSLIEYYGLCHFMFSFSFYMIAFLQGRKWSCLIIKIVTLILMDCPSFVMSLAFVCVCACVYVCDNVCFSFDVLWSRFMCLLLYLNNQNSCSFVACVVGSSISSFTILLNSHVAPPFNTPQGDTL
jgi:hypothetical protein